MCLVVIAWQRHAEFPLIIAGNRDEFHARPTQDARWWPDETDIVGGRDLQAAGSWLALHRNGRIATVTNFRDAQRAPVGKRSRGHLVSDFLLDDTAPPDFVTRIDAHAYAGFNLLVSDGTSLAWCSNRGGAARCLAPGIYGVSNALLDAPWHKVVKSKTRLSRLIDEDRVNETELLRLLDDRNKAPVDEVEDHGSPFATAHVLSAPFIVSPEYGTRSSCVALMNASGNWQFTERRFDADGNRVGDSRFQFDVQA